MRLRSLVLIVVLLAVACQSGFAWDGERRGFILGFGAGFSSLSVTQEVEFMGLSESGTDSYTPFQTTFTIGGAPSNQILIYYSSRVSWFGMENALGDNVTVTASTGTAGLSYYFSESSPCWLINGGLGFSIWDTPFEDEGDPWRGAGLFLGGGYEFSKHWSIEGGLNFGNPSTSQDGVDATSEFTTLYLTINVLGY